jgi:hypothetical protein
VGCASLIALVACGCLLPPQALESSVQLSKLPKSVIEVYVMVLQADGGELGETTTTRGPSDWLAV